MDNSRSPVPGGTLAGMTRPDDIDLSIDAIAAQIAAAEPSAVLRTWLRFTRQHVWTDRELWILYCEDGQPTPVLTQLADLPALPDDEGLAGLMDVCNHFVDMLGPGSFAFLLVRPGVAGLSSGDKRWATGIVAAAREAGIPIEPLHHTNGLEVREFAPDELVGPS